MIYLTFVQSPANMAFYRARAGADTVKQDGLRAARELPRYWTPEQVRQILVVLPAVQPGLFARLTG